MNIAKFQDLQSQGRMTPAGANAFAHRRQEKSAVYAYEQDAAAELSEHELQTFKRDRAAWAFFDNTPPSYRKVVLHWVTTAKRAQTRVARFAALLEACRVGTRLR